jgi:hypothetical protein
LCFRARQVVRRALRNLRGQSVAISPDQSNSFGVNATVLNKTVEVVTAESSALIALAGASSQPVITRRRSVGAIPSVCLITSINRLGHRNVCLPPKLPFGELRRPGIVRAGHGTAGFPHGSSPHEQCSVGPRSQSREGARQVLLGWFRRLVPDVFWIKNITKVIALEGGCPRI